MAMFPFDLRLRRFIGNIINPTAKNPIDVNFPKTTSGASKYKVHIPELMPFIPRTEGIWCFNTLITSKTVKTDLGIELVPGDNLTLVHDAQHFIIFVENDLNSGRILEPTGNSGGCGGGSG